MPLERTQLRGRVRLDSLHFLAESGCLLLGADGGTVLEWAAVMLSATEQGAGHELGPRPSPWGGWTMKCPQCGAQTPDEEWNCVSCRMNVYWASQHYDGLAGIRRDQGLRDSPETPPFLRVVHAAAMEERVPRGGRVEHKVRQIARRVMSERGRRASASGSLAVETLTEQESP